jgi:hypothetical protein
MGIFDNIKIKEERSEPVIKPALVDMVEPVDVKTRQENVQEETPEEKPYSVKKIPVYDTGTIVITTYRDYNARDVIIYQPQPGDKTIVFQGMTQNGVSEAMVFDYRSSPLVFTRHMFKYSFPIIITIIRYSEIFTVVV